MAVRSYGFRTNANQLAAMQRRRAAGVNAALSAEMAGFGAKVLARAVSLSQGPISTGELRRYHPGLYSRQLAANAAFDAVVNRQTGIFASSWRATVTPARQYTTVYVRNIAPYAGFMTGTQKMRVRPILDRAITDVGLPAVALLATKRRAERRFTTIAYTLDRSTYEIANLAFGLLSSYGKAILEL